MTVVEVTSTDIICKVKNNGTLSNEKELIFGRSLIHALYQRKDRADILFAIEHKFDFIAASFVRTADDVHEVRKILNKHKSRQK